MSAPAKTVWEASYYDGRSSEPDKVTVAVTPAGLWVSRASGSASVWPYRQIRRPRGRLEYRGQALVVADPEFHSALQQWDALAARRPGRIIVPVAALGVVVLVVIAYFWALPAVGEAAATLVPVSVEEQVGRAVADGAAPAGRRCADPRAAQALEQIVQTLAAAAPASQYRFRVIVSSEAEVNALAAPGGYIVVFRGLLEQAGSPEEMAGVLAHEMQHVLQRHTTRAIFRELTLQALLAIVVGDAGWLADVAGLLGELRFRREDEASADREGMAMLQRARIDPRGMVRFFETLEETSIDAPRAVRYLSTHPLAAERVETLERLAAQARYSQVRLLDGQDWRAIAASCGAPR